MNKLAINALVPLWQSSDATCEYFAIDAIQLRNPVDRLMVRMYSDMETRFTSNKYNL